ncbi:hypothetical protein LEP1GSC151_0584 [Leptospira interrogans serovar Grippotyphosa str. LT2186]|uniref:Uncharacterized protein n=3 Tax=Leptospira interrogans TaxID=173 RepID=M3FKF1_LEPIR|nr:hypothetical protein LEP1GSC151_0584 [Leptospira interrogans serovar Grippotyphosa str. LT2186]EMY05339.1 hypothetical protein LEP1GSC029_3415 [Leptospira interrogans str. 2002000626]EMY24768.1 hypothetical protein LEP1GSC115_1965 [Leptospira interrogans serovar Australis str. 200703203]
MHYKVFNKRVLNQILSKIKKTKRVCFKYLEYGNLMKISLE